MKRTAPKLILVVPCFNEEESLKHSAEVLKEKTEQLVRTGEIKEDSAILFVDDGSTDRTWEIIQELHAGWKGYKGIRFSGNRGHQIALFAGYEAVAENADAVISIDADLQQDVNKIPDFVEKYRAGYDIVYGVRNDRKSDGVFKKATATIYYKLMRVLGCELVEQSADYRLLSRRAVQALVSHQESNLFLRGLVPTLGFDTAVVRFDVHARERGESKYTLRRMIRLAMDGITSFSIKPLRIFLVLGIMISIISLGYMVFNLVNYLNGINVPGWTSLSMTTLFLGGVELIGIGTLGEYVGRTYMETKKRPRYFIEESLMNDEQIKPAGTGSDEQ